LEETLWVERKNKPIGSNQGKEKLVVKMVEVAPIYAPNVATKQQRSTPTTKGFWRLYGNKVGVIEILL